MHQRKLSIRAAVAVAAVVMGVSAIGPAAQAVGTSLNATSGENLESVVVDDTAGVLNEQRLRDALEDIAFNEPTHLAIYTREGLYSENINLETLNHAHNTHPDWISQKPEDHGDYWADGYFIITLSVESANTGQVGTYYGEDRKVSSSQMEAIHEAGYADFRQARWSDGVIAVAAKGASIMNRPWYKRPALWVSSGIGAGLALAGWGLVAAVRSSRRKKFAADLQAGTEHLTRVTLDLDSTELAARTLPSGSQHAADLERRFANFTESYRKSFTEQQELERAGKKERSAGEGVVRAKEFRDAAEDLDITDDAIIAASALYTRSAAWEDAWRAQTAPLLEDLDELPELTKDAEDGLKPAAAALDSYGHTARAELESIGTELKAEVIDVDTALDRLAELRKELTGKLEQFSDAQVEAYVKNTEEREQMREEMERSRYSYSKNHPRHGGSILDVTSPGGLFWTVQAYNAGYSTGVSAVDSSREAASSSGGVSHGYGGGGGSFSGAGGSSRF